MHMLLVTLLTMCLLIPWYFPYNAVQGQIIHNGKFLLLNGKQRSAGLTKGNHFVLLEVIMVYPMKLSGGWYVLLVASKLERII